MEEKNEEEEEAVEEKEEGRRGNSEVQEEEERRKHTQGRRHTMGAESVGSSTPACTVKRAHALCVYKEEDSRSLDGFDIFFFNYADQTGLPKMGLLHDSV